MDEPVIQKALIGRILHLGEERNVQEITEKRQTALSVFFRTTIRPFLVFYVRFSCSHFHKVLVRYRYRSGAFPKYDIGADRMKNEQERRIFPLENAHSR